MSRRRFRVELSPRGQFLALSLMARRDPTWSSKVRRLYDAVGEEALLAAAERNQVTTFVAHALVTAEVPRVPEHWSERRRHNYERVRSLLDSAKMACECLERAGCQPTVIEAAGTLLGTDLPFESFASRDVDILVAPETWTEVHGVMTSLGFRLRKRRPGRTNRAEYVREATGGVPHWLEIGSEAFERHWMPVDVSDRTAIWLERREPSRKDDALFVLANTDALVQASIHTSMHGYVRAPGLRLYVDIDRAAHDGAPSWSAVVAEARACRAQLRCLTAFALASAVLETPVDEPALEALGATEAPWQRVRKLLESESLVLEEGVQELGRSKALLLDALLSDDGAWSWIRTVLFPEHAWLAARFGQPGQREGNASLQWRRLVELTSSWRPQ